MRSGFELNNIPLHLFLDTYCLLVQPLYFVCCFGMQLLDANGICEKGEWMNEVVVVSDC